MSRAEMYNRKASSKKSRPEEILKALNIRPGQRIADIGAGGGYFSMRFARAAGRSGEVCSVDTNEQHLEYIRNEASKNGLGNITTVRAEEGRSNLPDNHFDLIFFRNALHHIGDRPSYLKDLKSKLRTGGRIAAVEYKPGGSIFNFKRLFGHNIPKEKIIEEFNQAGFTKAEEFDFLPEQSFTIFSIRQTPPRRP